MIEFKFKQVILVRTDLSMSKGKIAVQVGHAAVTASNEAREKFNNWWKAWIEEGQCKVALKVNSSAELFELKEKAEKIGLPTALIQDRGLTEIPPGTITCVGIGPGPSELIDEVTGKLPLL